MRRRVIAAATAMICSASSSSLVPCRPRRRPRRRRRQEKAAGADLFGLTRVVPLHIEIPANEYQAMQPPAPAGFREPPHRPLGRRAG